jgi:hypothetical protein
VHSFDSVKQSSGLPSWSPGDIGEKQKKDSKANQGQVQTEF